MWGDFNNRLVAFEGLSEFVNKKKPGKYKLTAEGAKRLAAMIKDPCQRRELLNMDSHLYQGRDISMRQFVTSKCNTEFKRLFTTHLMQPLEPVPLPSYKVRPLDQVLSDDLGSRLVLEEVTLLERLTRSWDATRPELDELFLHQGGETIRGADVAEGDTSSS